MVFNNCNACITSKFNQVVLLGCSSFWGFIFTYFPCTHMHIYNHTFQHTYNTNTSEHNHTQQQFISSHSNELGAGARLALCRLVAVALGLIIWPSLSTGSQAPSLWQVLINVTLGSVMISSHDTPLFFASLHLCPSVSQLISSTSSPLTSLFQ